MILFQIVLFEFSIPVPTLHVRDLNMVLGISMIQVDLHLKKIVNSISLSQSSSQTSDISK